MRAQVSLPIKMIGILSSMVFALSFSLEILVRFHELRSHQLLVSGLIICVELWALTEAVLIRRYGKHQPLRGLFILLSAQLLIVLFRAGLLLAQYPGNLDFDGDLFFFLSLYIAIFLGISHSIIRLHTAKLDEAHQKILRLEQTEMQKLFKQQTEIAVAESRAMERERLLQDMHDGFGSQLATAKLLAEHGKLRSDHFAELLQECIADLYLFTDTLSNAENNLEDGLVDLRYRTEQRCNHLFIKWSWRIALEKLPGLSQTTVLQILRILQEAINNALKHSHPTKIEIWAEVNAKADKLEMGVSDDGTGLPDNFRPGRGLSGMQQRAREISAILQIQRQTHGTRVSLTLPIKA